MKSSPMMTRKSAWNNATDTLMLTAVASPLAGRRCRRLLQHRSRPSGGQLVMRLACSHRPTRTRRRPSYTHSLASPTQLLKACPRSSSTTARSTSIDDSHSDQKWRSHLNASGLAKFSSLHDPSLCTLVAEYSRSGAFNGATLYSSDSFSVYVAMTLAGLTRALPVSPTLRSQYSCLAALP